MNSANLAEEISLMVNLKIDTERTVERDISQIHNVRTSKERYKRFSTGSEEVKNYKTTHQYLILAMSVIVIIFKSA